MLLKGKIAKINKIVHEHHFSAVQYYLQWAFFQDFKIDSCLVALPQCKMPFHWPRLDLDQLLCVNLLDVNGCSWSGGFRIDKTNSFHINIRYSSVCEREREREREREAGRICIPDLIL